MARLILRLANGLITAAVALALAVSGLYAGYALWDNRQINHSAENVQSEMAEIRDQALEQARTEAKPEAEAEPASPAGQAIRSKTGEPVPPGEPQDPPALTDQAEPAATAEPTGAAPQAEEPMPLQEPEAREETPAPPEPEASAGSAPGTPGTQTEPAAQREPAVSAVPEPENAPAATEEPESEMTVLFRRLKEINPDIGAWILMPDTGIDHPVVQGKHAFSYLSTDVYGNFAIVGSIFLDFRNVADYTDTYNLLYGHNMSEHRMFSDVNLYKEEAFFRDHPTGTLYLPDGIHTLQTLAVLVTPASNSTIFNPVPWNRAEGDDILRMVQEDALLTNETGLDELSASIGAGERPRIVALSTCSGEYTDARTILLTLLEPLPGETD